MIHYMFLSFFLGLLVFKLGLHDEFLFEIFIGLIIFFKLRGPLACVRWQRALHQSPYDWTQAFDLSWNSRKAQILHFLEIYLINI